MKALWGILLGLVLMIGVEGSSGNGARGDAEMSDGGMERGVSHNKFPLNRFVNPIDPKDTDAVIKLADYMADPIENGGVGTGSSSSFSAGVDRSRSLSAAAMQGSSGSSFSGPIRSYTMSAATMNRAHQAHGESIRFDEEEQKWRSRVRSISLILAQRNGQTIRETPEYTPEELWKEIAKGEVQDAFVGGNQMVDGGLSNFIPEAIQYGVDAGFPMLAQVLADAVFQESNSSESTSVPVTGGTYDISSTVFAQLVDIFTSGNEGARDAVGELPPECQRMLGFFHETYPECKQDRLYECIRLLGYHNPFVMFEIVWRHINDRKVGARKNSGHLNKKEYRDLAVNLLMFMNPKHADKYQSKEFTLAVSYLLARNLHVPREGYEQNNGLAFLLHGLGAGETWETIQRYIKSKYTTSGTAEYDLFMSLKEPIEAMLAKGNKMPESEETSEMIRFKALHMFKFSRHLKTESLGEKLKKGFKGSGCEKDDAAAAEYYAKYLDLIEKYNGLVAPQSKIKPREL